MAMGQKPFNTAAMYTWEQQVHRKKCLLILLYAVKTTLVKVVIFDNIFVNVTDYGYFLEMLLF